MQSYPENGLALEDLLLCAAEHRVTAALDLRSDLTAGRIDIVSGDVIDAVFGGLVCEAAIHAALSSTSLQILRGRTPRSSAPRRVRASTQQILRDWQSYRTRIVVPNASKSSRHIGSGTSRGRGFKGGNLLQRLIYSLVAAAAAVSTVAAGHSSWQWLQAGIKESSVVPAEAKLECSLQQPGQLPSGIVIRTKASAGQGEPRAQQVDVLVDENGSVVGARFEHSSPETHDSEQAALEALQQVVFEPAQCNGSKTASWANVRVELGREENASLARL